MLRKILIALIVLGAAAAGWIAVQRWSREQANRTVELTVEWTELQQLSGEFRVPLPQLLQRFRRAGVTSVALQEQTVRQLVDDGQVFRPDPFTDVRVRQMIGGGGDATIRRTVLGFPDPVLRRRVEQNLGERWGKDRVREGVLGSMPALIVDGGYAEFRDLGAGLDPAAQAAVRGSGLAIVGRVKNYAALTPDELQWTIKDLHNSGAHAVIFTGDEVLGNPNFIHETAADLLASGLAYGYVEFGKQHGDARLEEALAGEFLRVETIQGAEFSNLTPHAAVDRFIKAVRERGIRLCYIHLLSSVTGSSLEGDEDFVAQIANGVHEFGFKPGVARPGAAWSASLPARALVMVGVIAALTLLLLELMDPLPLWMGVGLALLLAGLIGALVKTPVIGEEAGALLAALAFPTLSLTLSHFPTEASASDSRRPQFSGGRGHTAAARGALVFFLGTSLLTLVGGLDIIGLLGSTLFMTKTHQFVGIKPAISLPVIAVLLIYWGRLLDPGPLAIRWRRFKRRVSELVNEPLRVGHVVVFLAAVVILGLLIARSGNDSAVGASVFELKTRHILDGWLIARPRTKEFLLGNPALYLAFYCAIRGWRKWALSLLVVGAIGQTSLVNTFCHIHTPLYISIFHALNGLWLGALIGWIASLVWDRLDRGSSAEVDGNHRGDQIR